MIKFQFPFKYKCVVKVSDLAVCLIAHRVDQEAILPAGAAG